MQAWIDGRERHRLSHAHVHMGRKLGMNLRKLGKIDNHDQEPWKIPLRDFTEYLYEKRFGRTRPEVVVMAEAVVWFRKSAELAEPMGQFRLGVCYAVRRWGGAR